MDSIRPINYEIAFEPDLEKFRFHGKETIKLDVKKPTSSIILNSLDLKINECHLVFNGKILKPSANVDKKKEELLLTLPQKISGKAEVFIDFDGELTDKLAGFYRSKYNVDGKEKYLATTQFEATDARRAFPCFDEPKQKATFNVSLIINKNLQAVSNMPITDVKNIGSKKLVKFGQTPVMSTYLLYIGVGEFEFLEDKLDKILIRGITTPGKKEQSRLAIDFAKKFLKFYQDYFGIDYPLPKLDLIALPDFAAGAMENWGAITFREAAFLYDKKTSSVATKQRIAEIVSHEIAHQWFGNLVTMEWWNDLWLNESFATFMATKAVDNFYPEWEFWSQFLDGETAVALSLDAMKTSHPIEVKVNTPAEIDEIFDEISYNKGGSILRMLENYLGKEDFRRGLESYLKIHKYGNATTQDFWSALGSVSNKPVKEIMRTWIRQTGYPVIDADVKDSSLVLSQKRFLFSPDGKTDKSKWMIPISVELQNKKLSQLMHEKTLKINLDGSEWFKINVGQTGFYIVDYPEHALKKLKALVACKKLSNMDRWGVQNDLFALVASGKSSLNAYLDLLKCYAEDRDYLVVSGVEDSLYAIYSLASGEKFWPKIIEHNKVFLKKFFDKLGWKPKKNEKHTDVLLRSQTIFYLGRANDKDTLDVCKEKFQNFLKNPDSLNPDLRGAVYNLAAWSGDEKTYEILVDQYRKAKTQEEKRRFLNALGGFKSTRLLNRTLDFLLSPDVRTQDMFIGTGSVAGNPYGKELLWPWIKKNWPVLKGRLGDTKLLGRAVESAAILEDAKVADDMEKFFKKNPEPKIKMALAQTLEKIRINRDFLERIRKSY